MNGYLLDTNVLSELAQPDASGLVARWARRQDRESVFMSEISIGEIGKGIAKLPDSKRRAEIEDWLHGTLLGDFKDRILPVDRRVWLTWGRLCGEAAARGRTLPALDALFAATAIDHRLTLVTRDARTLQDTGVRLFDPWRR